MTRTSFADWMPFHGDDFDGSEAVAVMSPEAEALYHRALWRQWREGSLPADLRVLRALFPAKFAERFEELWAEVAACFEERDGRLFNPRCEAERSAAQAISERRSNAGRTGGAASVEARSSNRQANAKQSSTSAQHPTGTGTETEQRETPPPPRGGESSATGSAPTPAPDPEPKLNPKRDPSASAHDAERVLREPEFAELADDIPFAAFWPEWLAHRREIRKPYKPRGARECLREVLRTGSVPWIAAARKSMAAGWQGVFPEKLEHGRGAGPPRVDPLEEFLRRHGGEGESAA